LLFLSKAIKIDIEMIAFSLKEITLPEVILSICEKDLKISPW
jgi:hypothetical protein